VQALRTALGQIDLARLGAVCITHQRETFVPVDERGRPLHPALVWMDERARGLLPEIERQYGREHFHRVTGKPLSSNLSVGKILWLRLHSPAVFEQTHKFLDVQGFLVHCLTGHFRTGIGSADPTGLFDMARGGWAEDLLAQLGVRLEQLPETFPQGTVLGQVSPQAAESSGLPVGLPVVAGIGDGQAAGLGVDITRPDEAFLNLGTAVVSGGYTEQFITDRAFRTTYGPIPGTYFIETVLPGGTYTINWFLSEFGDPAAAAMGEVGVM
jgi:xylulokinase